MKNFVTLLLGIALLVSVISEPADFNIVSLIAKFGAIALFGYAFHQWTNNTEKA